MGAFVYIYTIALVLICFAAAMLALAGYAVSRRRSLIPQATFFISYIIDICSIFFIEFQSQNLAYAVDTYYSIPLPLLRIVSGTGVLASLWLMLLNILDVHDRRVQIAPIAVYVLACCVVLLALPYGPLRQWLFYTLRQIFTAFGLGYAYIKWRLSNDMPYRERLGKLRKRYLILWILLVCILIEDWWIIIASPIPAENMSKLALYLSERNFSENAMMLYVAYFSIQASLSQLWLRQDQPPVAAAPIPAVVKEGSADKARRHKRDHNADLNHHIDEILPRFAKAHGLSQRESEVLALVIQGKSNREIANALYLSEGTIKTHVHNITKKCDASSRDDLRRTFWAS